VKDDRLTQGRARRILKVGGLTTSVGSSYIWQTLKRPFQSPERQQEALLETHLRNARRLVERSAELRGAFMKLTQLLSMRDDLLPSEALDVLSVVQSSVPPMSYDVIRRQVVRELGAEPDVLFARFEPDAFAAASLGQVHRAVLKGGDPVVVKVQYPGVEDTVEQDLRNVHTLLQALARLVRDVMRQDFDPSDVYRELEERLHEELDYVHEANNVALFQRMFADDPEIIIPRVYPDLSSRRVLTLTEVDGYPIADILKPGVDQAVKDWVAVKYFRVLWRQIFEFGILHTDPHPGNYRVTYHPKLGILDFGSIRIFPEEIRLAYRRMARGMLDRDDAMTARAVVELGFIDPDDDPAPLIQILTIIFEPVLEDRDYNPRDYNSVERGMAIATIGLQHRIFKAPGHRVFLERALLGLDAYLKQLGTVTNWHRLYREALERAEAVDVKRVAEAADVERDTEAEDAKRDTTGGVGRP
jgi:predicted unusual protein kinase regulating ubiquinone biosynthesis (AarF/ABC1/UbiB family)